ncbi:hypothetical protein MACK_001294 [Theileria orientalis]|uniref:Uncharacterized protein n=1 Tax=Theileria orientalis TaxID=68886 RepID=A0A976MEM2_THEOR|nr:hypothetical protein MACK_001294 [Theileria orientalis]
MSNRHPSIIDVIESFLLGLSCLIGGDQFYILLSHTNVSLTLQYCLFIFLSVVTFIAVAIYDCHSDLCVNGAHLCYVMLLGSLVVFVNQKLQAFMVVTLITSLIAIVVTYLVVQAFTRYSRTRRYLQSFLLGLFSSRLFPNFVWYFYKRRFFDYFSQLYSVSLTLTTARFAICLVSLLIKVGKKKFSFSNDKVEPLIEGPSRYGFLTGSSVFLEFSKKVRVCFFPFCILIVSTALYLTFPPTLLASHFNYSSNFISSLSFIEMTFHLLGCCFGIAYPVSKTGNDPRFYFITFFFYILYFNSLAMYYYFKHTFSHYYMFLLVMISGFSLGYLTTYTLHIVYNTTLTQTCISKEYSTRYCCCSKFFSECYCRFLKLVGKVDENRKFIAMNMFSCNKSDVFGQRTFKYSKDGDHAIIILHSSTKITSSDIKEELCTSSATCPCLKLIGIYKLESVTASTCNNCQLSVRLEASSVTIPETVISCGKQHSGGECSGTCSTCCFTINCCSDCDKKTTTKFKCCKKCKTVWGSGNDVNEAKNIENTKVFFCYSKEGNTYFREISPYTMPEFDRDLKIQHEFLIRDMSISCCCHADLQVDLHCSMKNNFFRLTQIEYKKKKLKIESMLLSSMKFNDKVPGETTPQDKSTKPEVPPPKVPEVPKKPTDKCCCENSKFAKLSVTYKLRENDEDVVNEDLKNLVNQQETPSEDEKCKCSDKCDSKCDCCLKGKDKDKDKGCCCCLVCKLNVDPVSSFIKRIDSVRVRLVCSTLLLLTTVCLLVVLGLFFLRNKIIVPYTFKPMITFPELLKKVQYYDLHSRQQIEQLMQMALRYCGQKGVKKAEVTYMLRVFTCVMNPHDNDLMTKYLDSHVHEFLTSSPRQYKMDAANWCFCSGFVFAYLSSVFGAIQRFFSYWEELWQGEYSDYRRQMSPLINKIAHKSKFALSLLSEVKITQQGIDLINKTRLLTWNEVLDELKRYTDLYSDEVKLIETGLPLKFDLRLLHYLDRWDHRVDHIKYLISTRRSIFDWEPFLHQYETFRTWYSFFKMFIQRFEEIISFPLQELNQNTKVFANYKI